MNKITTLRIATAAIVLVSFGVGALWLLVPPPPGAQGTYFYSPWGTPTTLVDLMFAIGSGVLFLLALRNFKRELKPAYRLIAAAQLSVGVLTMFFPYVEYYGLWGNVWFNMSSYLSYLAGGVLMYFGARQFLKILSIRSRLTSPLVVFGTTLVVWGVHAFVPHVNTWPTLSEHKFDLFEIVPIIPVVFYAAAAYDIFKIRRQIGVVYHRSLSWLGLGLAVQFIESCIIFTLELTGYDNWYVNSRAYETPIILADMIILVAAYHFNLVGLDYAAHGNPLRRLFKRHAAPITSVDIITYVAGLASNPVRIDPALDKMRVITAQMQPGQGLTEADQQVLRSVYLDIERYLVNDEPLRNFTPESLRASVVQHFSLDTVAATTFWPTVAQASS